MYSKPKLRVVFFASHSTTLLRQYWEQLKDKVECFWMTANSDVYAELQKAAYPNIVFKSLYSPEFKPLILYKILRRIKQRLASIFFKRLIQKTINALMPNIIISNTTLILSDYFSSAMKVLVFHSVPYKKYIIIEETLKYNLALLPNEYCKNEIIKRFKTDNTDKLRVVGWPRIDDFINNKFTKDDRDNFAKKIGLNLQLKNVLYAPTWDSFHDNGLFPKSFGNVIDAFEEFCKELKKLNINLIIRLHCLAHKLIADNRLLQIADKYNVCFVNGRIGGYLDNLIEHFLWITDVLISDISGTATDFMTLNRPIVYIEPDNKDFSWQTADLPKEYRAGVVANSLSQLIEGVKESLNNPERYKSQREELLKKIFYRPDGSSSKRAADEILSYYQEFSNNKGNLKL
ncbi:MAG: CDP-glycerol glycerophosphotransferase family protein [Candidatus Omnitrophica bacterium]|nr:CDP-glycerol glycerophosphotransferase family protein [Candidatus Omnitrophota bacterium]